jgi:hypothetical protein
MKNALTFGLAWALCFPCWAQEQPNATDTLSAYCSIITQNVVARTADVPIAAETHNNFVSLNQRFSVYMAMRIQYVDPLPLAVAMNNAKNDIAEASSPAASDAVTRGMQACQAQKKSVNECVEAEVARINATDLSKRMARCNSSDWLPF